ncbi:MAG: DUF1501 domain-containing protein, partial [Planctomycetota bacterium]|nr:DUF1501 domain-containing protein [Planctomycetota bacterium]
MSQTTPSQNRSAVSRRSFLGAQSLGLGTMALACLNGAANPSKLVAGQRPTEFQRSTAPPHFNPKVKRVIYLFQSGGPSQLDLFDYKPQLAEKFGEDVPKSVYPDERKTTMTSGQQSFPVAPSAVKFKQNGRSGLWLSEAQRFLAQVADELCV